MNAYLGTFFWGLFLLVSILGWGACALWFLNSGKKHDLGWQGSLGLSMAAVFGGFLNYFGAAFTRNLLIFLAVGFVFEIVFLGFWALGREFSLTENLKVFKKNKSALAFLFLIFLVVLTRYSFSVKFFNFNPIDDSHAYLVFSQKIIQTGSLGNDPFSERRAVTSLGGKYFLDSLLLVKAKTENLHIIDHSIGFIIFLSVFWGLCSDKKFSLNTSLISLLIVAIIPSPSSNVTALFVACALFLSLLRLLILNHDFKNSEAVLVLLIAGVCSLKSNFIPPAVIIFFVYFYLQFKNGLPIKKVFLSLLLSGCGILILLFPWMLSLYKSSGTFLYPYLGRGFATFSGGAVGDHYIEFNFYSLYRLVAEIINGLGLFFLFGVLAAVWNRTHASREKQAVFGAFFAALLGILALIYGAGAYGLYYYSFPFLLPIVLFSLIVMRNETAEIIFLKDKIKLSQISTLGLVFLFGIYFQQNIILFQEIKNAIKIDSGSVSMGLLNTPLVSAQEEKQYKDLQLSVPEGETILSRLDRNFEFDFKRNPVFIADSPGISSPGIMPYKQGPEALAKYLGSQKIRLVAYSYANEANFTEANASGMTKPHVNPLLKAETLASFDFQDNLSALGKSRKRIYDDGKNFVIDLTAKNN